MDARDSEDLADYAQRLYAKKKAQELLLAGRIVAGEVRAGQLSKAPSLVPCRISRRFPRSLQWILELLG